MNKRHHHISYPEVLSEEAEGPPLSSDLQERSRRAAVLLGEWMAAGDGYDEGVWPLVEEELTRSRTRVGSSG